MFLKFIYILAIKGMILKNRESIFPYWHSFMPGDLASNIRQLISYLTQISSALDLAPLNLYLSIK